MKVYFVRHGQTDSNKNSIHQFPTTPLSEKGIKQAEFLANRFASIAVDYIISSPYERALQTAKKIQQVTNSKLTTTDLLIERKNPSLFQGRSKADQEIIDIKKQIKLHRDDPSWHYKDEENFHDFKNRIKEALVSFEKLEQDHLVIVTHGFVLSLFALLIFFDEDFGPKEFEEFDTAAHANNTGLTLAEFADDKWRLLTWNDYAHLGE